MKTIFVRCIWNYSVHLKLDTRQRLRYGLDEPAFDSRRKQKMILFSKTSRLSLMTIQPPMPRVSWVLCARVKRPPSKVDYSPSQIADVKNGYSYIYTPPVRLQCVNRGSFTFLTATNGVIIHTALVGQGKLKVCIGLLLAPTEETEIHTHF